MVVVVWDGTDILLVLLNLSLLFMQLSNIQYGVLLFSGEMTLLQRLKNLPSFWAFRSLLSVKEGNCFLVYNPHFLFYVKKFCFGYCEVQTVICNGLACPGLCQNKMTCVCFCLNPILLEKRDFLQLTVIFPVV